MTAAVPGPTTQFNSTAGAFTLAALVIYVLFGVSLAQVVHYFRRYKSDRAVLKYMVSAVLFLEICHAVLFSVIVYVESVIRHGNEDIITRPFWGIAMHIVSVATVDLAVRVFFSYRIWQLSGSLYIPALLVLLSICSLAIGIFDAHVIMSKTSWSPTVPEATWSIYFSSSIDIVADVILALYMTLYLRRRRVTELHVPGTTSLMDALMMYSISTGLLTVIVNAACLIMFGVMSHNFIWMGIYAVIPQVFANSMFVALNARGSLRSKRTAHHDTAHFLSSSNDQVRLEVHQIVEMVQM